MDGKCETAENKKPQQLPWGIAAAVFLREKNHKNPYARIPDVVRAVLSSSTDLRITGQAAAFSGNLPMTDFRQAAVLHAYSGGTVRDFHTILYSSAGLLPLPQTLKR